MIGKNIKALRKANKMTQEQLAPVIGITRVALASYEEGRADPKIQTIQAICRYFGVTIDSFLNEDMEAIGNSKPKPLHAKPQLYAHYFEALKKIARSCGYNLVIHGSMNRDMDLVAIPWIDKPEPEMNLINAMSKYLTGRTSDHKEHYLYSQLGGGRSSYIINLNRGDGTPEDPQYYLDISVTPLTSTERMEYLRKQAITILELTKGFIPEQREASGNMLLWMETMADYVIELTSK